MSFDAAIFDLDGTLLNTLEDLADAMNGALGEMGHPRRTLQEYRFAVGEGMDQLARRSLPDHDRGEASVLRCAGLMRRLYATNWSAKTRPYDGVREMLADLAQGGIPLAILSNKPHDFAILATGHFFPRVPFREVVGAREGVPRKPDPAAALDIAAHLQVEPARVLFLGDTGTDMATALGAGMFPAGALWGFRPEAELRGAGAKVLLVHPGDLPALFREQGNP